MAARGRRQRRRQAAVARRRLLPHADRPLSLTQLGARRALCPIVPLPPQVLGAGGATTTTGGAGMASGTVMAGAPAVGVAASAGQPSHGAAQLSYPALGSAGFGMPPLMSDILAYDPINNPMSMFNSLGMSPFTSFFPGSPLTNLIGATQLMKCDFAETPAEYIITAEVPGVTRENLKIEVDDRTNVLHISTSRDRALDERGERGGMSYHRLERSSAANYRSLRLPQNANLAAASVRLENGLARVVFPKREGVSETGRRRIDIA
jgi:HSP20 family protein